MILFRNVVIVSLVVASLLLAGRSQAAGNVTDDLLGDLAARMTTSSPDARRSPAATALAIATTILPDMRIAPAPAPDSSGSQRPTSEITGGTAITPTLPQNGNQPTFTEADAIAYAREYPPQIGGPVVATDISAAFLSAAAAAEQIGRSIPRPDDAPICVVTLHGTFGVSMHGDPGGSGTGHTGILVFDAITGNLLMEGVR